MTSGQAIVSAFWTAADARDWATFAELLADDVVYEAPQSHERVTGKEAYLRFNIEGFPTDWHLTVVRIVADELGSAASWIRMTDASGTYPGLSFFELSGERIVRITDFWPEEYEPSSGRAHLTERFSL
jgi:ketosteroid isomerase-like protein